MNQEIKELVEQFIEQKGMEFQAEGLPRISGRMVGLMIIEDGPFSFGSLAEKLQVSRGSIGTNTRLLENLGILIRVSKPGDRQDYFQLASNPASFFTGILQRMTRSLKATREIREKLPPDWQVVIGRLETQERIYKQYMETMQGFIKDLENNPNT